MDARIWTWPWLRPWFTMLPLATSVGCDTTNDERSTDTTASRESASRESAAGKSPARKPATDPYARARRQMVRTQIEARGIRQPEVLAAMRSVPRHLFVPNEYRSRAYSDHPLPIGWQQTISQPYIVGFMTEALRLTGEEKVLEIGTGSGYQAAILGRLAKSVYTIEILTPLAERASKLLRDRGYDNVHVKAGDGYRGWPSEAPFDAILVTAAPDHVPQPLVDQLRVGGKMILPVGGRSQELIVLEKTAKGVKRVAVLPVRFVPMTGEAQKRR